MHICNHGNSLFCSLLSSPTQTPPLLHRPAPTTQPGHQSLQHHPIDERPYSQAPYFAGSRVRRVVPSHVPQLRNIGIPAATLTPSRCGAKPSPSSTTLPFCPRSTPCYVCVRRTQQSICLGLIVASSPVAAAKNLRNLATETVAVREIRFFICSLAQPSPLRQSTMHRVYSLGAKGKRFYSQKGMHLVY